MTDEQYDPAREKVREHLKLLAIFYYVFGGLTMLGVCFATIYIAFGAVIFAASAENSGNAPPAFVGGIVAGLGVIIAVFCGALGGLQIYVGRCLTRQRNRTLCIVMACLCLLSFPLGTLLGIFTLVVVFKPEAEEMFRENA